MVPGRLARWMLTALLCTTLPTFGRAQQPSAPNTPTMQQAQRLFSQASALMQQRKFAQAEATAQKALAIYEREPGLDPLYVAGALDFIAATHAWQGQHARAEPLLIRSLEIRVKQLGEHHPYVLTSLQSLATMHTSMQAPDKAAPYLMRAVAVQQRLTGEHSLEVFPLLEQVIPILEAMGAQDEVLRMQTIRVGVVEKAKGTASVEAGQARSALAMQLKDMGRLEEAERTFRGALDTLEKHPEAPPADVAAVTVNLAETLRERGAFGDAESLHRRALAMHEKIAGPESDDVATDLNNLGLVALNRGDHAQAKELLQRSIAMREKLLGPGALNLAYPLNNLAELHRQRAEYAEAMPLYERSLALREKHLGRNHVHTATTLQNLALLATEKGNIELAQRRFQEAMDAYVAVVGTEHPLVANVAYNYGAFLRARGFRSDALEMLAFALRIQENMLGSEHPRVADTLNMMGTVHLEDGAPAAAKPLLERALAITEKVYGKDHFNTVYMRANLADVLRQEGKLKEAAVLSRATLAASEKQLGKEHPVTGTLHNNLGVLALQSGDVKGALSSMQKALAIRRKALGPNHPAVAEVLGNLVSAYVRKKDYRRAVATGAESISVWEAHLPVALATGSEVAKQVYTHRLISQMSQLVALHLRAAPKDAKAARTGLHSVLAWKGRVLDSMTETLTSLRHRASPDVQALFQRVAEVQTRIAQLSLHGGAEQDPKAALDQVETLETELRQLQSTLSHKSAEYRTTTQPITLEAIQENIPDDAALVELVWYQPGALNGKPDAEPPHYAAFVMQRGGAVRAVDLGEASVVDAAVKAFRNALGDSRSLDVKTTGRALDALTMEKIRPLLGKTRTILLAPVSELNVVPFAALVDAKGRFLVEDYHVIYLTSGRDLLRLGHSAEAKDAKVQVIAGPDFGDEKAGASSSRSRSVLRDVSFLPLPGTHEEAKAIKALISNSAVRNGPHATEASIKALRAPRVLHIATHGFFFDELGAPASGARGLKLKKTASKEPKPTVQHPLLRSGLALAGANSGGQDGEDGVLTALEASGLDLWGTELVVLSACETGLGVVDPVDGVLGLRRALVMAGSRTQVMSLWAVDDDATRALMTGYYEGLLKGDGRASAMRDVQLRMLKDKVTEHPYYWAPFIVSGDWGALKAH